MACGASSRAPCGSDIARSVSRRCSRFAIYIFRYFINVIIFTSGACRSTSFIRALGMADTPARRLAANAARQREVGSMVVKLDVGGDWPEVLEHLNWLRPGDFLRAPGMRRYLVER
jgi:hypothetical protein